MHSELLPKYENKLTIKTMVAHISLQGYTLFVLEYAAVTRVFQKVGLSLGCFRISKYIHTVLERITLNASLQNLIASKESKVFGTYFQNFWL